MDWFGENIGTICAALILAAILARAVRKLIKEKKNGSAACGCGCAHCGGENCCGKNK